MEFNTLTLRPTYRLCWGVAGASNALAIARTLGFDRHVVKEAEKVGVLGVGWGAGVLERQTMRNMINVLCTLAPGCWLLAGPHTCARKP